MRGRASTEPTALATPWLATQLNPVGLIFCVFCLGLAQILVELAGVLLALAADYVVTRSSGNEDAVAAGGGGGAPQHIRRAVTRLGPNFVKIGQALASRPDLVGEAIAGELLLLQDAMPLFSNEIAREFIREVGFGFIHCFFFFASYRGAMPGVQARRKPRPTGNPNGRKAAQLQARARVRCYWCY